MKNSFNEKLNVIVSLTVQIKKQQLKKRHCVFVTVFAYVIVQAQSYLQFESVTFSSKSNYLRSKVQKSPQQTLIHSKARTQHIVKLIMFSLTCPFIMCINVNCSQIKGLFSLTLSLPIPLRLHALPYWCNPLSVFKIFDSSRVLWRAPECQKIKMVRPVWHRTLRTAAIWNGWHWRD